MSFLVGEFGRLPAQLNYVWDVGTLDWVPEEQPGGSTVGTVDQGAAGLDPWLVTGSLTIDPTGLATDTGQNTGNASLASIDGKLTNPLPIAGAVTNTNLDVALSTRLKAADTLAGVTTVGAVTALTNALPAGNNNIGDVDIASALPAGSAIIGNVRIDQTTPGTTNAVQANAGTNLNTSLLALEATQALQATAANQVTELASLASIAGKDFATQTTLALLAGYALALNTAQGAASADVVGPMVQGVVDDSPQSFADTTVRPLSLTSQGRLRVSTVDADVGHVWECLQASPWSSTENPWEMESTYV